MNLEIEKKVIILQFDIYFVYLCEQGNPMSNQKLQKK